MKTTLLFLLGIGGALQGPAPVGDAGTVEAPRADVAEASEVAPPADGAGADERSPAADPADVARVAFARATEAAAAGDYEAAALAFTESDRAIASPNAAFNAAYAYEKAQRWVPAVRAYEAYLQRYPGGEWRADVEQSLGRLSARVARLEVVVGGHGATEAVVWLDGERSEGTWPVVRGPGAVEVEVRDGEGTALETRRLVLYPGSVNTVKVELVEAVAPAGGEDDGRDDGDDGDDDGGDGDGDRPPVGSAGLLRGAAIGGGVLTGAAAVAVGVAGGLAVDARHRYETGLCAEQCDGGTYPADAEVQFERSKLAANVMIGVTGALAITTTALIIAHARARRRGHGGRNARVNATHLVWSSALRF